MRSDDQRECLRKVVERTRQQLDDGTWPEVVAVFRYNNPEACRTTNDGFENLRKSFEQAGCLSLARFVQLIAFDELADGQVHSYILSMRYRLLPNGQRVETAEDEISAFLCPDLLVGSRRGVGGAVSWLRRFLGEIPSLLPETVQLMDRIFGEVDKLLEESCYSMTVEEMLEFLVSETGGIPEFSKITKH